MLARRFAVSLLALAALAIASSAVAQTDNGQQKDKTLIDRIDNLGKTIFGGILPADKNDRNKDKLRTATPKPAATATPDDIDRPAFSRRAGSILDGMEPGRRRSFLDTTADDSGMMPENTPPAALRRADGTPTAVRRPLADSSLLGDTGILEDAGRHPPITLPRDTTSGEGVASNDSTETAVIKKPSLPPIHRRLSASRQSIFDTDADESPVTESETTTDGKSDLPPTAPDRTEVPAPETSRVAEVEKPAPTRPIVAQRIRPSMAAGKSIAAEPALRPATPSPTTSEKAPIETLPVLVEPNATVSNSDSDLGVLMSRKGPSLSVETLGPRRIAVGRESTYEVGIVNSGEVAGEDLIVFVSMPEWAEVAGASQHGRGSGKCIQPGWDAAMEVGAP